MCLLSAQLIITQCMDVLPCLSIFQSERSGKIHDKWCYRKSPFRRLNTSFYYTEVSHEEGLLIGYKMIRVTISSTVFCINVDARKSQWTLGCATLFLAVLVSVSKDLQANNVPALSRIVKVTCMKGLDLSPCHRCLVSSVGVNRIDLVQASETFRLYWVHRRYSDMISSFITSCSGSRMCRISPESTEAYTVIYSTLHVSHNSGDQSWAVHSRWEYSSRRGTNGIRTDVCGRSCVDHENSPPWSWEFFIQTQASMKNSSTFWKRFYSQDKYRGGQCVKKTNQSSFGFGSSFIGFKWWKRVYEGTCSVMSTMYDYPIFSRRCRLSRMPGYAQWVIRLANISLVLERMKNSAQLCVFHSSYKSTDIIKSCKTVFYSEIICWSLSDCARVDDIVTTLRLVSDNTNNKHNQLKRYQTQQVTDKKPKSLEEIQQILGIVAYKRMLRARNRSGGFIQELGSYNTLQVEAFACVKTTSKRNLKFDCMGCILKNVDGSCVTIVLSLNDALILTHPLNQLILQKIARKHVMSSKKWTRWMHELFHSAENEDRSVRAQSKPQNTDRGFGYCFMSFNIVPSRDQCSERMRKYFTGNSRQPKLYNLTKSSLVTYASGLDSELFSKINQNYLSIQSLKTYNKIQKLSHKFSSGHEAFLAAASTEAIAIDMFTRKRIPVGVWPPQNHIISLNMNRVKSQMRFLAHSPSDSGIKSTPFFNTIVLVEYECGKTRQLDCFGCLFQQHKYTLFTMKNLARADMSGCVRHLLSFSNHVSVLRNAWALLTMQIEIRPSSQMGYGIWQ